MSEIKKQPSTPANVATGKTCEVIINSQRRTRLAISHDYEDQNEKYKKGLAKRGIKLTPQELAERLITDELIEKVFIPQLNGKELRHHSIHRHWDDWKYYAFSPVYDKRGKEYRIVWFLDDNDPEFLGIVDCYRVRSKKQKIIENN